MPSTDPQPSPTPSTRPGLVRRTLGRFGRMILPVWLIGSFVVGCLAYLSITPTYKALSLLRVDPSVSDIFNVRGSGENLDSYLQTQVLLITSPNVLTSAGTNPKAAVLDRIQKAGDVVQELQKAVTVGVRPGTYLIEVSMTSSNGYEAATIVNAVVDAYIEANSEWSDGMTRQQIKNLEQYSTDLKNQTDELERKWKTLAAKGDFDLSFGGRNKDRDAADKQGLDVNRMFITIEEYRQIRQQLNSAKIELAQAQALLTSAKSNLAKLGKDALPADEQETLDRQVDRRFKLDPEVIASLDEMKKAEAKLSELTRVAPGPDDSALKSAKGRYQGLLAQYKQMWEVKSPVIRDQIALGGNALDAEREIREATASVTKVMAKQAALKQQLDQVDVKNKEQASDAVDIALIQDERTTLRGMQESVTRRLEQLRFEAKGEARIRPVNPNGAMVPNRPIADHRALVFSVIPLAMLFVVFGLFVGVEACFAPKASVGQDDPAGEV